MLQRTRLTALVILARLLPILVTASVGLATTAGASPLTYYFQAPSFPTPLPAGIPSDDPTLCGDSVRNAQTNCGVSYVSMLFTIDSNDITPGAYFSAPMTDWLVFDGLTLATEGIGFSPVSPPILGADASGLLTSMLIEVRSGPFGGPLGSYDRMVMLWDSTSGVLNVTGHYCVAAGGYCSSTSTEYVDVSVRQGVASLTLANVPEPSATVLGVLAGIGLVARAAGRRGNTFRRHD